MNWNNIPNNERLRLWKELRKDISTLDLHLQIEKIADFCKDMPYSTRTIDYYSPAEWPTPWEILFYGDFCKSSISLLMFYTLKMISSDENIELLLVDDMCDIYLLPIINDTYILNYYLGQITNDKSNFTILKRYSKEIKTIR